MGGRTERGVLREAVRARVLPTRLYTVLQGCTCWQRAIGLILEIHEGPLPTLHDDVWYRSQHRWKHQSHSHQHFVQSTCDLAALVEMQRALDMLVIKKKKKEKGKKLCCQTTHSSSSPNAVLAGGHDNPNDCKIGWKLPAAVCKLSFPPGRCLINLTDVWAEAHVINFTHKLFTPPKLHLQPCCRFLLDSVLDKTCESAGFAAKNAARCGK